MGEGTACLACSGLVEGLGLSLGNILLKLGFIEMKAVLEVYAIYFSERDVFSDCHSASNSTY